MIIRLFNSMTAAQGGNSADALATEKAADAAAVARVLAEFADNASEGDVITFSDDDSEA